MSYDPTVPNQSNIVRTTSGDIAKMRGNFEDLAPLVSGSVLSGTAPSAAIRGFYLGDPTNRKRYFIESDGSDVFKLERNVNTEASPSWETVVSFGQGTGTDITLAMKAVGVDPIASGHLVTKGYLDAIGYALSGLSDVNVSGLTSGQVLEWDGSEWQNVDHAHAMNDLTDVSIASPSSGQAPVYNGAQYAARYVQDVKDARDYGATGDGVTDDTEAIQAALDDSNVPNTYLASGVYVVSGLTIGAPGELRLSAGATLKMASGVTGHVITVSADEVLIDGPGTIDGNAAEQSASGNAGIYADGVAGLTVDDVRVTGCPAQGLYLQDSDRCTLRDLRVDDTGATGIMAVATSGNQVAEFWTTGCLVDRTANAADDGGGIKVHDSSGDGEVVRPQVEGCTVLMDPGPTGANAVGIEYWGDVREGRIGGCTVSGASIGVSVANGASRVAVTNCSLRDQDNMGIELADCDNCAVAGNVVDGNDNATTGIVVDGSSLGANGNAVTGNAVRAVSGQGFYAYTDAEFTTFAGNSVEVTSGSAHGIRVYASDNVVVEGNALNGSGGGGDALLVYNSSRVTVHGNLIRSFNQGVHLVANNEAHDYVHVDGNNISDLGTGNQIFITEQGSGTYGDNVTLGQNHGYNFGALSKTDSLRYKATGADILFRGAKSSTPEGSITADAGSFVQVYGTANPAALAFLKATSSGNTGWEPVQVISEGDTASRPTGLGAAGRGFRYFDTDVNAPVWWDGSDWVSGAGGGDGTLSGLTDTAVSGATSGQLLGYDGSDWVPEDREDLLQLGQLSNVSVGGAVSGQVLKFDGSNWVPDTDLTASGEGAVNDLPDLGDVSVDSPTSGQVLTYTGSGWENQDATGGGSETLSGLTDTAVSGATSGQLLGYDGSDWVPTEAPAGTLSGLSDTAVSGATSGQRLEYDGSDWVPGAAAVDTLSGLTDTAVSGATSGQVLEYDGSDWVPGEAVDDRVAAGLGLVESFDLAVESVASGDAFTISLHAFYPYDVKQLQAKTTAGTCDLTFTIEGTAITGLSGVTVSGTETGWSASAANSVASGETLAVDVEDASACSGLLISLKTERT